jgi:hypothetical protein
VLALQQQQLGLQVQQLLLPGLQVRQLLLPGLQVRLLLLPGLQVLLLHQVQLLVLALHLRRTSWAALASGQVLGRSHQT